MTDKVVLKKWIRIAFINLFVVAFLGVVMRYKIAYSLPFIDQKKFLHAHSHFAFTGWITQALMVLLTARLSVQQGSATVKKYKGILLLNLISAYGMLLSFPLQGYGVYSITFSTLSIFVSYAFAVMYWIDLNRLPQNNVSCLWLKAAVIFNVISSLGAFALAGMMATKTIHQNWYLQAVYFFLHFQYNGWFFFACMGLFADKICQFGITSGYSKIIFWLFAGACIPAYILSVLWIVLPAWAYILVVLSAIAQLAGWVVLITIIGRAAAFLKSLTVIVRRLFLLSASALSIKLMLQLGSTVPFLSRLAFGFRPVVIAYLHLVLLGVITLFIIGYAIADNYVALNKKMFAGVFIFTAGIILNEVVLMMQGIADLNYVSVPYTNEMLLVTALIMLSGIALLNFSQAKLMNSADINHI